MGDFSSSAFHRVCVSTATLSNLNTGGSYEKFGLSASIVASAFGKMIMKDAPRAADVTDADIARSLLNMVGHNIAQLAYVEYSNTFV